MRWTLLALVPVVALAAVPATPREARAAISPAVTIDGPSPDVLDVGGVAMAEDGTGGIVYRKRVEGRAHVFAAQLLDGRWREPQRVDSGQRFDSSWPRIGAGNRGHLVVTWVHEFGPSTDRLFSATLDAGARRFQQPVPIDLNVGEALATHPSLAMNRGGAAYLAYRVLGGNGQPDPNAPPGYFDADVRLARYNGRLWTVLGFPADRNEGAPVATPTAANGPRVGIDVTGNGIVAFHEPDDEFVDRIWARRVFGSVFGVPLTVGPREAGGRPLRGPVDAFALDVTGFGQGAIALRQLPGQDSALTGAHVFVTTIAEAFSDAAGQFTPALLADGSAGQPLPDAPGTPSVGVTPDGRFRLAFGIGRQAREVTGTDQAVDPPVAVGDGAGAVTTEPLVEVAESEAAVTAWRARSGVVAVRETGLDRRESTRGLSDPAGGPVRDLVLAGSNLGDGLVGFIQGDADVARVTTALVDAPALEFAVQVPLRFVRNRRVRLEWDPARNGLGPLTYAVYVGGRRIARGLTATAYRFRTRRIRDGRHRLRVVATDRRGQRTNSVAAILQLDRRAPRVRLSRKGRTVRVRIVDGRRGRVAGPTRSPIRWGDGRRGRGTRARHRYKRAGAYAISVRARDRAGNTRTTRSIVRIP